MSASYRLTGDLDAARVKDALTAVARRHEILRPVHGNVLCGWTQHDLTDLPDQARELRIEVLARRAFATGFDPSADAPLRLTLIRTGPAEHVLLVAAQIAWDDTSLRLFLADLTLAYDDPGGYAELPVIALTAPPDTSAYVDTPANVPEPLELPGPNGSVVPRTSRDSSCSRRLSAQTVNRVSRLAGEAGTTPYAIVAAAVSALIARYTQTDDFLVASSVSSRTAQTAQTIGDFGRTVFLRASVLPHMTFRGLLTRIRDSAPAVIAGATPHRLARLGFEFREPCGEGFCPAGVTCTRETLRGRLAHVPLRLTVEPTADGAVVEAAYSTEVLDRPLVTQMLTHLEQLLDSALREPDTPIRALDMLGPDLGLLQRISRGDDFDAAPTTLGAIVQRQVEATPDAVAVACEGQRYTYRELNEHANRFAHWLIGRGIGTEDRVAVLLDRSPHLAIAALGIAKAGAVYLPVDPAYPADRIETILADSAPRLVLRDPVDGLDEYPAHNPTDIDRVRPLRPDNLAFIIYTSGSTGTPKGVPMPHAPVAEYIAWFGRDYQNDGRETVLQLASTSFDASIEEIFGTLGNGARLVIPRPGGLRDVRYLTDLIERERITAMHLVPSLLGLFLSLPGVSQWRTLRRVPIGGEALPGELADRFHATFDALLHNFYGPTETAIATTKYRVLGTQGHRVVPIGRPKVNTSVHLLDNALQPVPIGVIGEIYIGGRCLARGYLGRAALTAERFVADPYAGGGRMYRTGDLARRNAAGDLEFVGRADEQVKVRGFRIELGEVAASASVDPSVGQCVVVLRDLPAIGRSLVAYMTPSVDSDTVDVDRVRARVSAALPDYMTPAAYVVLEQIPITAHGKFDRDALPDPVLETVDTLEPVALPL